MRISTVNGLISRALRLTVSAVLPISAMIFGAVTFPIPGCVVEAIFGRTIARPRSDPSSSKTRLRSMNISV